MRDAVESARVKRIIVDAFAQLDAQFLEMALDPLRAQPLLAGSTAVVLLLHEHTLTLANLGDSRAVLARGGQCLPLSVDHTPKNAAERARVEAVGGWVTESQVLDVAKLWRLNPRLLEHQSIPNLVGQEIGFVTLYRVLGELLVTRAIGDAECKGALLSEYFEGHTFTGDVLSSVPDVLVLRRDPERDAFVLLACDGFWDVFESADAVQFCSARLAVHAAAPAPGMSRSVESPSGKYAAPAPSSGASAVQRAAEDLVQEALRRGSLDNISLCLVVLEPRMVHSATSTAKRELF